MIFLDDMIVLVIPTGCIAGSQLDPSTIHHSEIDPSMIFHLIML